MATHRPSGEPQMSAAIGHCWRAANGMARRTSNRQYHCEGKAMNILLTGMTGVIGSRVVPLLQQEDHRVAAVARAMRSREALARAGVRPLQIDRFAVDRVRAALHGQDTPVNLPTHLPASMLRVFLPGVWRENDRLRKVASAILVDAALDAGVKHLV